MALRLSECVEWDIGMDEEVHLSGPTSFRQMGDDG